MARLSFRAILYRSKGSCLYITKLRSPYCYLQRSMVSFTMKFGPKVIQGFMSEQEKTRFPGNFSRAPTCSREAFPIRQFESRLGRTGVGRREVSQLDRTFSHQCCPEMTFTNSRIKGAQCLLFCYFLRKLQDLQVHCRDLSAETWTHQKAALAMPDEFVFNPMSRFVSKTYLQQAKQERCTISALRLMNSACFGPVAQWRATKSIVFQLIRPKFPQDRSWKHSSGFFFISYPFISINLPKKKWTTTQSQNLPGSNPNYQIFRFPVLLNTNWVLARWPAQHETSGPGNTFAVKWHQIFVFAKGLLFEKKWWNLNKSWKSSTNWEDYWRCSTYISIYIHT